MTTIQRSLSAEIGGTATVDYAPDGLVCVMEAVIRYATVPDEAIDNVGLSPRLAIAQATRPVL